MSAKERIELVALFSSHLRARIMLRDLLSVERELLTQIVDLLQELPEHERESCVRQCVEKASEGLIADAARDELGEAAAAVTDKACN